MGVDLKQMMASARKWRLDLLDRNDLMSLSERAAKVTEISMEDEVEKDAIEKILDNKPLFLFSKNSKPTPSNKAVTTLKRRL